MRQKVIVVGAGVAGLTAAHELNERDFDVVVIERRKAVGGKASSRRTATGLPAEHGFRFFPGWYQHLPHTLGRIRTGGRRKDNNKEPTVLDSLVSIDENQMLWSSRSAVPVPMHLPRSVGQAESLASLFMEMGKLDLAPGELFSFFFLLGQFLLLPEDKRRALQDVTWWQYVDADRKSRAFKDLIHATTRTMVAAKATEASAYTICRLAIRTLSDVFGQVDRILDGPTSEKWFEPWIAQLQRDGVEFHYGWELEEIVFDPQGRRRIDSLRYANVLDDNWGRLSRLVAPIAQDFVDIATCERTGDGDSTLTNARRKRLTENLGSLAALQKDLEDAIAASGIAAAAQADLGSALKLVQRFTALAAGVAELYRMLRPYLRIQSQDEQTSWSRGIANHVTTVAAWSDADFMKELARVEAELLDAGTRLNGGGVGSDRAAAYAMTDDWTNLKKGADVLFDSYLVQRLEDGLRALEAKLAGQVKPPATADYFVMALPVEQMAYHVNRSAMMTTHDPSLERIVRLANHTDWMAGIQFYLTEETGFGKGHMIFMDSEWALTAIEQAQFWPSVAGVPRNVNAIVSVDIAAWDRRGRHVLKEAYNCTDQEIAEEVWEELKASVRSERGQRLLHDGMLVRASLNDPPLKKGTSFELDDSIVDLCDRRKQGAYEKARSVRPSVTATHPGDDSIAPYMYGTRLRFNVEPLLVNRIGSHQLRPEAKSEIENMFLASDYVRTETDLACMEGANEAARCAVNALLDDARSPHERCAVFEFSVPGGLLRQLTAVTQMHDPAEMAQSAAKMAAKMADAATRLANQAFGSVLSLWEKKR